MALKVEVVGIVAELKALNVTQHAALLELQQLNATLRQIASELSPEDEVVGIAVEQTGTSGVTSH